MIRIRKAEDRGHFDHGWLNTYHTFSFGDYQDPQHVGFHSLRVMNEDRVRPGHGFGNHPHRDMEIVTYVLSGSLEHKDSMGDGGNSQVLRPGELQRMSAGSGITHSETNPSATEPAHFYQIWLFPERTGLEPSYQQKRFPDEQKRGQLRIVASPTGRDHSLTIHQDVEIYLSLLEPAQQVIHALPAGRGAWLQVLRGAVTLNDHPLSAGDGAAVGEESRLTVRSVQEAELLLFDLA